MDAKRIELIEKHLAGATSENVDLHAKDFCELVSGSRIDDEGLKKAAKSLEGHVGFVAVNRDKITAMIAKVRGTARPSSGGASGTTSGGSAKS